MKDKLVKEKFKQRMKIAARKVSHPRAKGQKQKSITERWDWDEGTGSIIWPDDYKTKKIAGVSKAQRKVVDGLAVRPGRLPETEDPMKKKRKRKKL